MVVGQSCSGKTKPHRIRDFNNGSHCSNGSGGQPTQEAEQPKQKKAPAAIS